MIPHESLARDLRGVLSAGVRSGASLPAGFRPARASSPAPPPPSLAARIPPFRPSCNLPHPRPRARPPSPGQESQPCRRRFAIRPNAISGPRRPAPHRRIRPRRERPAGPPDGPWTPPPPPPPVMHLRLVPGPPRSAVPRVRTDDLCLTGVVRSPPRLLLARAKPVAAQDHPRTPRSARDAAPPPLMMSGAHDDDEDPRKLTRAWRQRNIPCITWK